MKGKDLKLLICGGRSFTAYELLESVVDRILETMEYESIEIVSGHARGVDSLGEEYAKKHNIPVAVFKAEWKKYGRPAGPIRNARMVEYISNFDMPVVVAFKSPNSKGTMHTVGLAKSKNIKVYEVDYQLSSTGDLSIDEQLYKGIFWIKDIHNFDNSIVFRIKVDSGNFSPVGDLPLNSKNADNYNHRLTWNALDKSDTEGHDFDYYPRGRVEIKNGKALVFANPNICTDELKQWVIRTFNLSEKNGIKQVILKPDFSKHYKCFMEGETNGYS